MDTVSAYRAGRVTEGIVSNLQKAHEKNLEVLKKWVKKDERGHFVPVPNSVGEFEFPDGNKEKYEAELKSLEDTEFVVKANKIEFQTLKDCNLSPAEIMALDEAELITEPLML